MDLLVIECPDAFRQVGETDIDKRTYERPKPAVTYRKPIRISEAKREPAREAMKKIKIETVTHSLLTYKSLDG